MSVQSELPKKKVKAIPVEVYSRVVGISDRCKTGTKANNRSFPKGNTSLPLNWL